MINELNQYPCEDCGGMGETFIYVTRVVVLCGACRQTRREVEGLARATERLQTDIVIDPVTGCRVWQGTIDDQGYGRCSIAGQMWLVHRLAWTIKNGPIPDGLLACHHCDNPPCTHTDHLFLGTQGDNIRDAAAKGRLNGRPHWNAMKTHCKHGHEFTDESSYVSSRGKRVCRVCDRFRQEARKRGNADLLVTSTPDNGEMVA